MDIQAIDKFQEIQRKFDEMKFSEKINMSNIIYSTFRPHYHLIKYDGYVAAKTEYAVDCDYGEHYVYLWKHLDGDIFYVGSGKGNRYKNKFRNDIFLRHIDQGDSVVYIVLAGVDITTARFYERYISGSLGVAGYTLANGDNNVSRMGVDKFNLWLIDNKSMIENDLTRKVEDVILAKILTDKKFDLTHIRDIEGFKKECGDNYFSSQFGSRGEKVG